MKSHANTEDVPQGGFQTGEKVVFQDSVNEVGGGSGSNNGNQSGEEAEAGDDGAPNEKPSPAPEVAHQDLYHG